MSDLIQLGQHPDADQLNAFVEHALPAHEREQMLAHLAGCAECREIVALSLPPLEEAPVVEADSVAKAGFGEWFSGWRLAWIAAPALATLVVLAIHLRNTAVVSKANQPGQVAAIHPPSPQVSPQEAEPLLRKASTASRVPSTKETAKAREPRAARTEPLGQALPVNGREVTDLRAQPAPEQVTGGLRINGIGAGMAGRVAGGQIPRGPVQQADAIAPSPPQTLLSLSQAPLAASANSPQPAASAPLSTDVAENALPQAGAQGYSRVVNAAPARGGFVSTLAPLPSGQSILSLAASVHKLVVLDTQGTLFYSQDEGRHWKQVSPAWKGRAIAVARVAPAAFAPRPNSVALGVPERFKAGALASATASAPPEATESSLSGSVTDASGATIPGATVVVQEARYALVRAEKTDSNGHYAFRNLTPGSYRIDINAPGFKKQSLVENIASSQQALRNIILSVGHSSETVTVDAASVQLETQSRTEAIATAKVKSAKPGPPMGKQVSTFVITTDTGDRWTSPDGMTWTHE